MRKSKPLTALKRLRLETVPKPDRCAVAAHIGVCDKTLEHWEEGRRQPPLDVAGKLADFYGVPLDDLAGRQIAAS